jgi:GNAT superfamily N-acetyltransferase
MRIRPASRADYPRFAALYPELGAPDPTPDEARWCSEIAEHTLLLEHDGAVAGYGHSVVMGSMLYVRQLVTAKNARRRGVGRALMRAMQARGRDQGATRFCLYVVPDNTPALGLYRAVGLEVVRSSIALRVSFESAETLPAGAHEHVELVAASGEHDDRIEASLGLVGGQLAMLRAQDRVLLLALDGDEPVGFASFDPAFPGAFPFRARDEEAVRALFVAMRAHARPELHTDPWRKGGAQVVIEGNEALAAALSARGAEVSMRTVFMQGELEPGGPDIGRQS